MRNDNRHDNEHVKIIADMLEQNIPRAEVAERLGITRARVGQIVLDHGLSRTTERAQRPLSKRQAQVLAFLQGFAADNQYAPTIGKGVEACNLSRTAVATTTCPIWSRKCTSGGSQHRQGLGLP